MSEEQAQQLLQQMQMLENMFAELSQKENSIVNIIRDANSAVKSIQGIKEHPDSESLVPVGMGTFIKTKTIQNEKVVVNEYTERDKLIELTSDIPFALVSLDPNLTIEGFPGKTFDYLSMNKIILCFANENSAVARFIEKYKVGINIDPKNINNLGDVIEKLNSSKFIEESLNNVAILNKNEINKEKVIDNYLSLI